MRRISCLFLTMLFLIACTACQPTPEEEVVVSRDSEVIKEKLGSGTAIPAEQTPAPEEAEDYKEQVDAYMATIPDHWNDKIEAYVDLTIDADIVFGGKGVLPVYEGTRANFSSEQVETLANIFFSDVTGIREGDKALPEEYAKAIASLNERGFTAYAEAMFRHMQETPEGSYTETDHISSITERFYVVRTGDGNLGHIIFLNNYMQFMTHYMSQVHVADFTLSDGSIGLIDGAYDGEGEVTVEPTLPLEQAEEVLDAFLQDMGIDGFSVESVYPARYFNFLYRQEISQGWYFILMSSYGYVPVNTSNLSEGLFRYEDDTQYSPTWEGEKVVVYISEAGVEYFIWSMPMEITGIASQNVELMDFEQIQENAKKLLTAGISWMESDFWKGEMTKMVLTVIPQQVQDEPDKAYLMPVWVMLVDWYFDGDYMSTTGVGINALDGSRAIMN